MAKLIAAVVAFGVVTTIVPVSAAAQDRQAKCSAYCNRACANANFKSNCMNICVSKCMFNSKGN